LHLCWLPPRPFPPVPDPCCTELSTRAVPWHVQRVRRYRASTFQGPPNIYRVYIRIYVLLGK
jgi:hypothetical protein